MSVMILPDEEAGQSSGARGFDILLDHKFASFSREDPAPSSGGPRRLKSVGRRSMGQPDRKLGRQAEDQSDHQKHAETGEHNLRSKRVSDREGLWVSGISGP
jgi:hypothetical protein